MSRLLQVGWILAASGCFGIGAVGGAAEQHRKDDIAQAWNAWAVECGLIDTGDPGLAVGACSDRDLDRIEGYVECLEAEGCDAQGACAEEAKLDRLDPGWCPFEG